MCTSKSTSLKLLTTLLPDVLDPAAHDVPSGLSQRLTGTDTGSLLSAGMEEGQRGRVRFYCVLLF